MKKLLPFLFLFTLIVFNYPGMVRAQSVVSGVGPQITAEKLNSNAEILAAFLASYNSPMQYHAQDFIDAAKKYDLDWRLLPSIAGVESTFGKRIPGGYNAYGWGVYGNQAIYFESWTDGIFTVAKGLREGYLDKGLTDPYSMNRVYAESKTWGNRVTFFMEKLEKFAQDFKSENVTLSEIIDTQKVAAVSGQLVLE